MNGKTHARLKAVCGNMGKGVIYGNVLCI